MTRLRAWLTARRDTTRLRAEVRRLEAELALERYYRTRGGPPPPVDKEWGNRAIPRPEHTNGR